MIELWVAVTAILASWSLMALMLVGLGRALRRLWRTQIQVRNDLSGCYWVGFAAALGLAVLWNLFWPSTIWFWVVLAPGALFGWWPRGDNQPQGTPRRCTPEGLVAALAFAALAIRLALLSAGPVHIHDTGSYHLPATLWAHASPAVPGLANLHGRLGFNSSLFPFAASLATGPWTARPHHLVLGLPILMLFATSLTAAAQIARRRRASGPQLFALSLAAPAIYFSHWGNYPASLGTNCVSALLLLCGAHFSLRALLVRDHREADAGDDELCAVLLLSAAVSVKMTAAPFAALVVLLLAWRGHRASRDAAPAPGWHRPLWRGAVLLAMAVPWLLRSLILSGYPLYPVAVAPAPVDWRVPVEQARMEAQWTRDYARGTWQAPAEGLTWIPHWLHLVATEHWESTLLPLGLALLGVRWWRSGPHQSTRAPSRRGALQLVGCTAAALALWFLSSPDPRFAAGLLWILAGLSGSFALRRLCDRNRHLSYLLAAMLVVPVLAELMQTPFEIAARKRQLRQAHATNAQASVLDRGLVPVPTPSLGEYVTTAGLHLKVPLHGNQVWAAPLLSTPHPSPGLEMRNPSALACGFRHRGPWQPAGFPSRHFAYHEYVRSVTGQDSSQ